MISLEDKEGSAITELIFPKMDVCRITNQRYMEGTFSQNKYALYRFKNFPVLSENIDIK